MRPELSAETLSYAGRLDPMAEGLLLVLVGDENNHREEFLHLNKEYNVDILFGIETDTYDILGNVLSLHDTSISAHEIEQALQKYCGTYLQKYPPYSSQPVNGKPLFEWARAGKLDHIVIPGRDVTIYSAKVIKNSFIQKKELLENSISLISSVQGDFRQQESIESWKQALKNVPDIDLFQIAHIQISCSPGTYMRSLAHLIGKDLKSGALAYRIVRTKVGKYTI